MANKTTLRGRLSTLAAHLGEYHETELARELVRLACIANPAVLRELEFKNASAIDPDHEEAGLVTVPVVELTGEALIYAWKTAFGRCTASVARNLETMPVMARYVLAGTLGETAKIPAKLLQENQA